MCGHVGGVGVMTMLGGAIAASSIARAVATGGAGSVTHRLSYISQQYGD
jgi:hypothetical protein